MPFIEPQVKIEPEELKVKIDPSVMKDLKEYADFLNKSAVSYVVQELLRKGIAMDRDFKKYRGTAKKPAKVQAVA